MCKFMDNDPGKKEKRKKMNRHGLTTCDTHKDGGKGTGDKTRKEKKNKQFEDKKQKIDHLYNYIEHAVC